MIILNEKEASPFNIECSQVFGGFLITEVQHLMIIIHPRLVSPRYKRFSIEEKKNAERETLAGVRMSLRLQVWMIQSFLFFLLKHINTGTSWCSMGMRMGAQTLLCSPKCG